MTTPLGLFNDTALADELRSRGFVVTRDAPGNWEKPAEFSRRIGRHSNYLAKLIDRGNIPPGLEISRANGGKGRIVVVRGNAETEQWIEARKQTRP
jgi:hypothetical protein